MKFKAILFVIVLVLTMSMASATYDLSVDSVNTVNAIPTVGVAETVNVVLKNNGLDNITGETISITVDFGDTTSTVLTLTNLNAGVSTTLSTTKTWTAGNTYALQATASNMVADNNAANDMATATVTVNTIPTLSAINTQVATVATAYSYQTSANDADGNALTYSLSGNPAGMAIDSNGLITWTPISLTATTAVTVTVNDGMATTTKTFSISANNPGADLTTSVTTVKLGSNSAVRGTQVTQTFTITNTGSEAINNIVASPVTTQGNALSTDFNAQAIVSANSLAVGASATVTVIMTIPMDKNTQENTIGKVQITGTSAVSAIQITENVFTTMEAETKLIISDIKLEVNGNSEGHLDQGDNYDNLKEGDEITLSITLENTYASSTNIEIQNAYVKVEDENWDIDEESNDEDISDNDDQKFEITFTLDDDINDDVSEFTVQAYGEDGDDNFDHYDELTFELEIKREKNEISIRSLTWDNEPASCADTYATLNVRIKNTGTYDQDEAAILVNVDELDWHKRLLDIELDEGDSETQEFKIPVRNVKEGSYFVEIDTYYKNTRKTDSEVLALEVECGSSTDNTNTNTQPSNPTTGTGIIVNPPTGSNNGGVITQPVAPTSTQPTYGEPVTAQVKSNDNLYLIALAIVVLLLFGAVLMLTVRVLRK